MKLKFVVEFMQVPNGRKGVIEFGTSRAAAKCAAEVAFVLGAHGEPQNEFHWFHLNNGKPRASWECPTGAWVTVTRIERAWGN